MGAASLALAASELALRLVWPQPAVGLHLALLREERGLAFLVPGARARHLGREFDVSIEGNALSYRAGAGGVALRGATWVLGDSFAFGWGVEAASSATGLLARRGIPIVNLAMPADGLPEYLARLERALASGARPGSVLVLAYDNDFAPDEAGRTGASALAGEAQSRGRAYSWSGRVRATLLRLHAARLLGRLSAAAGLQELVSSLGGLRAAQEHGLGQELAIHRAGYVAGPVFAVHRDRLESLARRVRELGVAWTLVRIAGAESSRRATARAISREVDDRPSDFDFGALDERLEALALAAGGRYVRFPERDAATPPRFYFGWDKHLAPAGHAALAEALEAELLRPAATPPRASAARGPARG